MFILDYANKKTEINIDITKDEIVTAVIEVLTGDEILTIVDNKGNIKEFDSSEDRYEDDHDTAYYLKKNGKLLPVYYSDIFQNRENHNWYYDYNEDFDYFDWEDYENNKINGRKLFVGSIYELLVNTRNCKDIRLVYGYHEGKRDKYNRLIFHPSLTDIDYVKGKYECVAIYWGDSEYPTDIVSIECDSLIAILEDVTKKVFARI